MMMIPGTPGSSLRCGPASSSGTSSSGCSNDGTYRVAIGLKGGGLYIKRGEMLSTSSSTLQYSQFSGSIVIIVTIKRYDC